MTSRRRFTWHRVSLILALATASTLAVSSQSLAPSGGRRMSVHTRLLLNRLAVGGYRTLEVMFLTEPSQFERISASIPRVEGRIRRSERSIGYIRAEMPIDRLMTLVTDPGI